jgi:hypothetical protein
MAEDKWWADSPFATASSAKAAMAPTASAGKAKTTPQDMKVLGEASSKAQAERDALRDYDSVERDVKTFGTGPLKARLIDALTPDQDGGILDAVGGVIGIIPRSWGLPSEETLRARDHLNTVSAQTALRGSQQMKGSSSDKDTALMRMAGVSPYKSEAENLRIMAAARRDSALEQTRAGMKAAWIARHGSLAAPSSTSGRTFEQVLAEAEDRQLHPEKYRPRPAPPSTRRSNGGWSVQRVDPPGGRVVIDLNGNPVR